MTPPLSTKLVPLVSHIYSPFPGPLNCTTFPATNFIAEDPAHPLYIKTQRRLALFDRNAFHFRVHCPLVISKKCAIRDTVKKTFQKALVRALEQRGWGVDGKVLDGTGRGQSALRGAFLLNIAKDPERVLQASKQEIRSEISRLVDSLVVKQVSSQRRSPPEGSRWQSMRPGEHRSFSRAGQHMPLEEEELGYAYRWRSERLQSSA